jgi:hypothetical protein
MRTLIQAAALKHAAALCAAGLCAGLFDITAARAQEEAREEAEQETLEEAATGEVTAADAPPDPMAYPPAPTAADAKWARWGTRFIDRPRTLPRGMIEAGGYLNFDRASYVADGGAERTDTITRLYVAGGYGISDQLEARVSYGLALDPFEGKGPLSLGAALSLLEGPLAFAVAGDFNYDLGTEVGELGLGARVRYKILPQLSLYSFRQLQVTVIADGTQPANLRLPLGAGYQLTDKIYGFAETELASINLRDSATFVIFDDYVSLTAGGVFAISPRLEVGGLLNTDLKNDAFDTLFIELFGRIYL